MNGAVSSLPSPGMVEVEKECDILGSPQLWLQADHSYSCFSCRREHLLPQNHDSHGGKSHFLLQQQSSLKMRVVTEVLPRMVYSAAFPLLLLLFLH